jgi:predicted RNA binding protein YcfA (HicA-like mRNA interferase family)
MANYEKLLAKILRGTSDAEIPFVDMCHLLLKLGFVQRIKGNHHIFVKNGIEEIINVQPEGSKAKPYQVKQIRSLVLRYKLTLEESNGQ